jgi:peptidoglycan L-alanyl-D-glutamate endopeptidase CwlK
MPSRRIEDLHPDLQAKCREFVKRCEAQGVKVLITCTYRSNSEQSELYAQGRTKPGKIVTRAKAGQSEHNFTIAGQPASKAFDFVPLDSNGKAIWATAAIEWQKAGSVAMGLGLNWYGKPGSSFVEYPHVALPKGK